MMMTSSELLPGIFEMLIVVITVGIFVFTQRYMNSKMFRLFKNRMSSREIFTIYLCSQLQTVFIFLAFS